MPRAFVAVLLDEQTRRAVAAQIDRLRPLSKAVAWVPPHNLHLTLRFLGDQTEEQSADVVPALEEAASGVPTFTLSLKGFGAFPGLDHPRTLWVGVSEGVQEVQRLQARVAEALESLGVSIEARAWQAHVTIGRVTDEKRGRREGMPELRSAVMRGVTVPFGSMPVASIALMRSDLYTSGARYTGIASVPLSSEYDV
ncbi:MAG TPA: RNA 2',3'-cyclic phosphodiesterase [Methylomirabilota bacterium]|nr:RNA 2',3'-cyclic phosphodiesterase [Methylomirabilota bacterium]